MSIYSAASVDGSKLPENENRAAADIWYLSISLSYYTFEKIAAVRY